MSLRRHLAEPPGCIRRNPGITARPHHSPGAIAAEPRRSQIDGELRELLPRRGIEARGATKERDRRRLDPAADRLSPQ